MKDYTAKIPQIASQVQARGLQAMIRSLYPDFFSNSNCDFFKKIFCQNVQEKMLES